LFKFTISNLFSGKFKIESSLIPCYLNDNKSGDHFYIIILTPSIEINYVSPKFIGENLPFNVIAFIIRAFGEIIKVNKVHKAESLFQHD
jgi:hypothetical protein